MKNILIKNGYIYQDNNVIKKDILISNERIIQIKDNIKINNNDDIIDATNKIIIPGFINNHLHFGEYYVKGYNEKLTTEEYIKYTENFNSKNIDLKEKIRVSSTIFSAYESLESGSTTLVGIRGWKAIDDFSLRLFMGYPLMNSEKLKEYLDNPFNKFEQFQNNSLQTYYMFLHSIQMVNEKILSDLANYLKNKNIKLAIHLSETLKENEYSLNKYHMTPIEILEKFKLLNENTLLVHCCYLSNKDIKIIKKKNCTICICPNSNLKLNNKLPDIKKLLDMNINICIGTDGSATNDSLNLINCLKTLALLSNIKVETLFEMITTNAAKYLKVNIGKININYKADLLLYDLNNYRIVRKEVFLNNLIYSDNIKPIYVIINGKVIIKNYKNIIVDKKQLEKNKLNNIINF